MEEPNNTLPWEPIANVYVLADGTVVVRYMGLENRMIAVQTAPAEAAEEWQGDEAPVIPAGLEEMVCTVLVSDHHALPANAGRSVAKAVAAYLEGRRIGGAGIVGMLGPKRIIRPDAGGGA